MSDKKNEIAKRRIPLRDRAFERLRDFSNGLSATYDETIEALLDLVMQPSEDEFDAGRRVRKELNKGDQQLETEEDDDDESQPMAAVEATPVAAPAAAQTAVATTLTPAKPQIGSRVFRSFTKEQQVGKKR